MPFLSLHGLVNPLRLAKLRRILARVNAMEAEVCVRNDARMRDSASLLRKRLSRGETLDDLLPEAFALAREMAKRKIGQHPFDVQVMGGIAIHLGWIAEMQTGEGKTLTATMPAFLNGLTGRGVHVVTVNDYLAKRDAEWMGEIYRALGLTVGCLVHGITDAERIAAYGADITYGTNKEFAFDYLRDQLRVHGVKMRQTGGAFERLVTGVGRVQREHNFAIVDEVDSILIDESRVPLIISNREEGESPYAPAYRAAREVALRLRERHDYTVDETKHSVEMTIAGIQLCRQAEVSNLPPQRPFEHLVQQALRAERLYRRDREYLLVDDKVCIVDEFTGRTMPDRSWSLGLHQAVETKEGVPATEESRTTASITFQRFFKLYRKLSGMSGTVVDASSEFRKVFNLSVATIPTNRPMRRKRLPCRVFVAWDDKSKAIVSRILELHAAGRPVLVGTRSVYRSEALSAVLAEHGVPHSVLNARKHAEEAAIVAQAGQAGKVTIATNMAGRGVDIMLGSREVAEKGGLHVLGTEFHEARRIDRQLGGRAGRQGDRGSYEFFVCLEDEILSRWSDTSATWLQRLAWRRGDGRVSRVYLPMFYLAQRWIEHRHLGIRVDLLKYDEKLEEMKGSLGIPVWG